MPQKLNISEPSTKKTWKLELDSSMLVGKKIGENVPGSEVSDDLSGYELKITGATDSSGFAHKPDVEGQELKRVLLTKGWGQRKKQKGLRKRKNYRGNIIAEKTVQICLVFDMFSFCGMDCDRNSGF